MLLSPILELFLVFFTQIAREFSVDALEVVLDRLSLLAEPTFKILKFIDKINRVRLLLVFLDSTLVIFIISINSILTRLFCLLVDAFFVPIAPAILVVVFLSF